MSRNGTRTPGQPGASGVPWAVVGSRDCTVTRRLMGGATPAAGVAGVRHNKCYLWAYAVTSFVWLVNAVVSAVLLFRFLYLDSRTATSFITNNLLLVLRFIKGYGVRGGRAHAGRGGRGRAGVQRPEGS
jgi:hypothetical protein